MTLDYVLKNISAPMGLTSVVDAIFSGDMNSISSKSAIGKTLSEAKKHHEEARENQRNCTSDSAYWGYQGQVSYWSCVVNLLKASEIVGSENLKDISLPKKGGILMEMCRQLESFGKKVLSHAEKTV